MCCVKVTFIPKPGIKAPLKSSSVVRKSKPQVSKTLSQSLAIAYHLRHHKNTIHRRCPAPIALKQNYSNPLPQSRTTLITSATKPLQEKPPEDIKASDIQTLISYTCPVTHPNKSYTQTKLYQTPFSQKLPYRFITFNPRSS